MTVPERLLAPLSVGAHTLRNRVVMGSMHTRLEQLDRPIERQAAFYAARAAGGVGLIVTGGYSPNLEGLLEDGGPRVTNEAEAEALRPIVQAVQAQGAKILLQILHAGRYAKHDAVVGVSPRRASINPRTPRVLTGEEIEGTLDDFVRCAELAAAVGFDGVELMGSEGYLINQFTAPRTNDRQDAWGGSEDARGRFAVEVTRRIRRRLGTGLLMMYRISAADLLPDGASADETDALARRIEAAGADLLNTGYGWHEAPVPTIAYQVPRAAWAFGAARLKRAVSIPVVASNRVNTPEVAEALLASGACDLVSMARPLLADPGFVAKAAAGRATEITPCIACNQSCLDAIFTHRSAGCLVNPRACRELEFDDAPAAQALDVAVVGAGPAGLAAALEAARRGHRVTLYEAQSDVGGQLLLARRIPGKQEFDELLRWYRHELQRLGIHLRLGCRVQADALAATHNRVIVATGIVPRRPAIDGVGHRSVVGYLDVILGRVPVGRRVAILGAGGIGHDVAELLAQPSAGDSDGLSAFYSEWGVDASFAARGACAAPVPPSPAGREITILQRSPGRPGALLGKSTGWVVRSRLARRGVQWIGGVQYRRIDDAGLHYADADGLPQTLVVDTVVLCTGQDSDATLADALRGRGIAAEVIGGARDAARLDAARAIDEGTRLAGRL